MLEVELYFMEFLKVGSFYVISRLMLTICSQILILRAWPRLTPSFQEIIVKTILLNCIALIRRDTNDHVLVRFLPLVNECIASIVQLKGLVCLAQCLENAQKAVGDITITSTKVLYIATSCVILFV